MATTPAEGLKLVRPEALAKLGDSHSRTHGIKALPRNKRRCEWGG